MARRFEHVHGAHHVGRVRLDRLGVAAPHQRLRGEVEDRLRAQLGDRRCDADLVAHVDDPLVDVAAYGASAHRLGVGLRRQREPA